MSALNYDRMCIYINAHTEKEKKRREERKQRYNDSIKGSKKLKLGKSE